MSMIDISQEIQNFLNAIYGKDVRSSLVSLANKLKTAVNDAIDNQLITVDSTLSTEGSGADAKATGDLIRQNTADIGDLTDLVTEDQSSLVNAINETKTDLSNWLTDEIEKVKYIYEGSGSDADIYEVQRLEWDSADDADITGLKVITKKEGTSTDTTKFFVDGNELMEYVIGDTSDLSGTITEEISDLKSQISDIDVDIEMTPVDVSYELAFVEDIPEGGGLAFDSGYQDAQGYIHLTKNGVDLPSASFTPFKVSVGGDAETITAINAI